MPRFDVTDVPIAHDNYPLVSSSSDGVCVDSGFVSYSPEVPTDWDGEADPGHVDAALDQLARRLSSTGSHRQLAHQWYLEDPEVGDAYVLCKVPAAATIERVNHIAIGTGSSADFNIDIRHEATPETHGTDVWNTGKTVHSIHSIETAFDHASVSQYQILVVTVEAVGGVAPDRIWIGLVLEYGAG